MEYLHQDEIIKLEDKDLQLRYLLGGLNREEKEVCAYNTFWGCDIRCSCGPVPDDERFQRVKRFVEKHNISNDTFMRLMISYIKGYILKFNDEYGDFILELDRALSDYKYIHSKKYPVPENDFKEKELLEFIERDSKQQNSELNKFLTKYNLTLKDFLVLAKTSINYNFRVARGFDVKDLPVDLKKLIVDNDLYQSYEFMKQYHEELRQKEQKESIRKSTRKLMLFKRNKKR